MFMLNPHHLMPLYVINKSLRGKFHCIRIIRIIPPKRKLILKKLKKNSYNSGPVTGLVFLHAMCLLAPFTFTWKPLASFCVLYWIAAGWGVCLCYHRLLTHRSFQFPKWLESVFTACGTLPCQG